MPARMLCGGECDAALRPMARFAVPG
eukprot:SAG11_NODE_35521_length_266_cov_0.622754_1_plen_25_part_01